MGGGGGETLKKLIPEINSEKKIHRKFSTIFYLKKSQTYSK